MKKRRLFFWLLQVAIAISIFQKPCVEAIKPLDDKNPLKLYASQCDDNLQKIFLKAINRSKSSILLTIYSLNDEKIIQALNRKAENHVDVKLLIHHASNTPQLSRLLHPMISTQTKKLSGLMHQKILVIDKSQVWLGSANMTTESLLFHDNLVLGMRNPLFAQEISQPNGNRTFYLGDQMIEFWPLPEEKKLGLQRLIELLNQAKRSIRVAMYAWSHPALIEAVIQAHERGIDVEVVLDYRSSIGISRKTVDALRAKNISLFIQSESTTLHHKFSLIDGTILINGSTNWTQAAFSKNAECFVVIHDLNHLHQRKMQDLWYRIRCTSKPITH